MEKIIENIVRPELPQDEAPPTVQDEDDFFEFTHNACVPSSFAPQGAEENELMQFFRQSEKSLDIFTDYLHIKSLFVKYNTMLTSSAPVERLFSYATPLNIPKFNKLTDTSFEKRVICLANSK